MCAQPVQCFDRVVPSSTAEQLVETKASSRGERSEVDWAREQCTNTLTDGKAPYTVY